MNKKITALISLLLSSVLILLSCATPAIQAKDLLKEHRNTQSGDDSKISITEITHDFKQAFARFSFNLFKDVISKDDKNELFSPLSAIICLAMLANGADGNTKTQMEDVFGMDIDSLNENLYLYTSSLYSADDCVIRLADSIWFRNEENRLTVNEKFLKTNAKWYDSQIFSEPFNNDTLKAVNSWCEKQTDGMIKEMFEEIEEDDMMFLLNALVFDAKWEKEISEDDENPAQFINYGGEEKEVQMLDSNENVYISGDGFKGFTKNYIGGKYSFLALLPDENIDIYYFIDAIDSNKWFSIWESRSQVDIVDIKMPVFNYELKMDLLKSLKALGMVDLFTPKVANLTKLGHSDNGNLYCSSVDQKVFIELTRKGTKAAAITQATVKAESYIEPPKLQVYLNRPFIYALVDNNTGLPFLIGALTHMDN